MRLPQSIFKPSTGRSIYLVPLIAFSVLVLLFQIVWVDRHKQKFARASVVQKVDCEYCGGMGLIKDEANPGRMRVCPICFGLGGNYVRGLDQHDNLCPACAGMGRLIDPDSNKARVCKRCDGRGLIRTEPGPTNIEHRTSNAER